MGTNFYEDNQFTISIHYLTAVAMNTTAFDCAICDPYTGACRADLGICLCRAYWGGDDCSESMIASNTALSRYFLAHIIIFCVLFGGIFAFGLAEIVILCRGSKRAVNKPTLLMFITCVFVGAERIVFLAVFRYGQVKELAYVGSTLMEGIVIWAIVFMHSLVLLFWFGAYISTIPRKSYLIKRVRIAIICVVIFFLLLELARDIVYGILPLTFKQIIPLQVVTQIIVALIVLPSAIILLVFGTKLTKELSKFKELSKARRRLINRINNFAKSICGAVIAVVAVIIVLRIINVTTEREYPAVSMAILSLARLMEVLYCFMILITYHREVKTPEQSTTSSQSGPMAISTAGGNTASGDDVQLTSR